MRKSGDLTNKLCWKLSISIDGNLMFIKDFKTLKEIADELNLSYNVVSEMSLGRKKNRRGKYEPQYNFTRL